MNTVHVDDVCSAMWHCRNSKDGSIFNLADKTYLTQGILIDHLGKIFNIEVGFLGKMGSSLAKTIGLKGIAETANEKHLAPWSALCKEQGIASTPLSPYIDSELLFNNGLWIDGSAIEKDGFKYTHEKIEQKDLEDMMKYYQKLGLFPKMK